jgi:hypothetical protein
MRAKSQEPRADRSSPRAKSFGFAKLGFEDSRGRGTGHEEDDDDDKEERRRSSREGGREEEETRRRRRDAEKEKRRRKRAGGERADEGAASPRSFEQRARCGASTALTTVVPHRCTPSLF